MAHFGDLLIEFKARWRLNRGYYFYSCIGAEWLTNLLLLFSVTSVRKKVWARREKIHSDITNNFQFSMRCMSAQFSQSQLHYRNTDGFNRPYLSPHLSWNIHESSAIHIHTHTREEKQKRNIVHVNIAEILLKLEDIWFSSAFDRCERYQM